MPTATIPTTVPGAAHTVDEATLPPALALVVLWSASQPHRVGEVSFFPTFEQRLVGRGDIEIEKFARFDPQRPGETPAGDPRERLLTGDSISRRQLLVRATAVALEVESVGRCVMLVNGEERQRATVKPGDTVRLQGELLLLCTWRPRTLRLPAELRELHAFGEPDAAGIVGESPASWSLREDLARVAGRDDHVLLRGESGTGKELAAQLLHKGSKRANGPFVAHNASTFTLSLLASELFGNPANYPNKGMPARKGLLGAADRGTLFLDEIGDCPIEAQVQLLRALDSGEYKPVGETASRRVDVRIVGATNRDDSRFRGDFFARFLVRVRIPPLRERQEDIPLLIRHWLLARARAYPEQAGRFIRTGPSGRREPQVSGRLVDHLVRHPLPLNVRQLHGLLLEAVDASRGDVVRLPSTKSTTAPAPPPAQRADKTTAPPPPPSESVEEEAAGYVPPGSPSKAQVVACLDRERGNVSRVARALGLQRNAVYRLMQSYGIKKDDVV